MTRCATFDRVLLFLEAAARGGAGAFGKVLIGLDAGPVLVPARFDTTSRNTYGLPG